MPAQYDEQLNARPHDIGPPLRPWELRLEIKYHALPARLGV